MAIGYGSNFAPPAVQSGQVGKNIHKHKSTALLKWLTIIGEIGFSLVPGIGTAGLSAIALGGSFSRLGISIGAHEKVSTLGTVFDFASAGIPLASEAIKGYKLTSKFVEAGEQAFEEQEKMLPLLQELARRDVMSGDFKGMWAAKRESQFARRELNRDVADLMRSAGSLGRIKGYEKTMAILREEADKVIASEVAAGAVGPLASWKSKSGFFLTTPKSIMKHFSNLGKVGIPGSEAIEESLIQKFQRAGITEAELFSIGERLGLEGLAVNPRNLNLVLRRIEEFGQEDIKALRKIFREFIAPEKVNELYRNKRTLKGAWRRINSSEFYGRDVQYVQAVFDPNDLGRAPIEFLYRKAKRRIEKWFDKQDEGVMKAMKKFGKNAKVVNKQLAKDIAIWEKNGGLTINSRYLFGIKPLGISIGSGLFKKEKVLVKFHKNVTNTKTGKNIGGKKDIIVNMTQKQMMELKAQGSSYWWANGKKYGWFTTRGGKAKFGSLQEVSGKVSMYLSFLPVQAFRALGSIFSNLSQFGWGMASGEFQKTYFEKLSGSFIRSAEGRAGRLFGKAVLGGKAGQLWGNKIGYSVGMAAQGISSAGIHSIKGQGSWGQNFMKLGENRVKSELMIKSKGGIRGKGNAISQSLTGQRYLGITRGFATGIVAPFKSGGKRPKIPKIGF